MPAAQRLGLDFRPFSHARNSIYYDGWPPCCGNNTCVPICPILARYDGSVHALKAEALGARIVDRTLALHIDVVDRMAVSGIRFRRPDGSEGSAHGRCNVLACHAIENPRLLLASRSEKLPNGVANLSGVVGRYLPSQFNQDPTGITRDPV